MTPILSSWSIGCSCKYIEYHIKYHQINTPDWLIYIFLSSYWQCKQVILGINNIFCQYVNWCPCVKIFHFSDEKQLTYFNCGCIVSYTVSSHYCMENVGTEELQLSVESWQSNVRLHIPLAISYRRQYDYQFRIISTSLSGLISVIHGWVGFDKV